MLRQGIIIVCASILTAVIMSFIAPNGLRKSVQDIQVDHAAVKEQVRLNTERLQTLEYNQYRLATKEDLKTLKEDLIRELKK
jgi:hypothetical protein